MTRFQRLLIRLDEWLSRYIRKTVPTVYAPVLSIVPDRIADPLTRWYPCCSEGCCSAPCLSEPEGHIVSCDHQRAMS